MSLELNYESDLKVECSGSRLDRYVSDHLNALSRAAVQRLIEDGQIRVNGLIRKASYRVQVGETITVCIPPPEPAIPRAETIPLTILYEDDNVMVIDKPAGMVVHPAAGRTTGTLVNAILAHCPALNVGGVERPGIVHRLDSDTSGIIIIAKNDRAMHELQAQFKSRSVHKTYLALVEGEVKPLRGKIDAPIGRDPIHRQRMAVISGFHSRSTTGSSSGRIGHSRSAVTVFNTLSNLGAYTLLQIEPQTGRTHQIRVHLAFLGYPIVGDKIYGKKTNALGLARQFLHAWKITFILPLVGREVTFTAPIPKELYSVLNSLGYSMHSL